MLSIIAAAGELETRSSMNEEVVTIAGLQNPAPFIIENPMRRRERRIQTVGKSCRRIITDRFSWDILCESSISWLVYSLPREGIEDSSLV